MKGSFNNHEGQVPAPKSINPAATKCGLLEGVPCDAHPEERTVLLYIGGGEGEKDERAFQGGSTAAQFV